MVLFNHLAHPQPGNQNSEKPDWRNISDKEKISIVIDAIKEANLKDENISLRDLFYNLPTTENTRSMGKIDINGTNIEVQMEICTVYDNLEIDPIYTNEGQKGPFNIWVKGYYKTGYWYAYTYSRPVSKTGFPLPILYFQIENNNKDIFYNYINNR